MESNVLTPGDIEAYRSNPVRYFKTARSRRHAILDAFCGPVDTFVFKRQDCSNSICLGDWKELMISNISACMQRDEFGRAAQVMWFFQIPYFKIGILVDTIQFPLFMQSFEFGCFPCGLDIKPRNEAEEWCHGRVGPNLVRRMTCTDFSVPDAVFDFLLRELTWRNSTTKKVSDIVNAMDYSDTNADRRAQVLAQLSQWRFKLSDDESSARPYIFLMAKAPDAPRPVWSRSRHLQLATESFKKETFTILLMRKWRSIEFPLHKDLVDILLGHIFDLHVADSVNLLGQFERLYAEVVGWRASERERFYLKQGIHVRHTPHYNPNASLDRRSDAVYLKLGISIGSEKMNGYAEDLRRGLCRQAFPNETVDATFRGNAIIEYCKLHKIALFDVLKRRVILKSDQITAELSHEDGEILSDSDEEYYP